MKPVCVPCQRFYRPHKNGVYLLEQMPIGNDAPPGRAEPERWTPYKVWQADHWKCQGCGHELVFGAGFLPLSEHFKLDFETWRAMTTVTVNDC